jgi:hypothetical protein
MFYIISLKKIGFMQIAANFLSLNLDNKIDIFYVKIIFAIPYYSSLEREINSLCPSLNSTSIIRD